MGRLIALLILLITIQSTPARADCTAEALDAKGGPLSHDYPIEDQSNSELCTAYSSSVVMDTFIYQQHKAMETYYRTSPALLGFDVVSASGIHTLNTASVADKSPSPVDIFKRCASDGTCNEMKWEKKVPAPLVPVHAYMGWLLAKRFPGSGPDKLNSLEYLDVCASAFLKRMRSAGSTDYSSGNADAKNQAQVLVCSIVSPMGVDLGDSEAAVAQALVDSCKDTSDREHPKWLDGDHCRTADFMSSIFNTACKAAGFHRSGYELDGSKNCVNSGLDVGELQSLLKEKLSAVISFPVSVLDPLTPPPAIPRKDRHGVAVIGMKKEGEVCWLKIRNSWGTGCGYYNSTDVQCDAKTNEIWVKASAFPKSDSSISYLRKDSCLKPADFNSTND